MVRYNVDKSPNGNIDGIQPTVSTLIVRETEYPEPIRVPSIHLAWNIALVCPVEDGAGRQVDKPKSEQYTDFLYPCIQFTSNECTLFPLYYREIVIRKMNARMSLRSYGRPKENKVLRQRSM